MKDWAQQATQIFELSTSLSSYNLKIVLMLAIGFAMAGILGYFALRLKLSPILGYLLAGYAIGPYSPGFVADMKISEQLAEIGVILMLFGVGLDFKVKDLMKVRKIAIPGAIGQTLIAALLGTTVIYLLGWPWKAGITIGLAISVASTVVLVRMLAEHHLLRNPEGHIAVGWLIVEDIITVLILLLLPSLSKLVNNGGFVLSELLTSLALVVVKFIFLIGLIMTFGKKCVSYILTKVMHTRSHELFTLSTLALVFFDCDGNDLLFWYFDSVGGIYCGDGDTADEGAP